MLLLKRKYIDSFIFRMERTAGQAMFVTEEEAFTGEDQVSKGDLDGLRSSVLNKICMASVCVFSGGDIQYIVCFERFCS